MKYRWQLAPVLSKKALEWNGRFCISRLLAQCLLNRGLEHASDVETFLNPRLKTLSDPFDLPGMTRAVERLLQARERAEPVVLFGDYDVDGVTSTTLLTEALRRLGWNVDWYLPQRFDEGYGLSREGVANCLATKPCSLLLAVDCGSTAVATIDWLQHQGIDVLVLDHHQISDPPPAACSLVNPRANPDPDAIGWELCSVGLAFKLAHALVKRGRDLGWAAAQSFDLRDDLDLVALGTIADVVPLDRENRILVSAGLERLNQSKRPGIVALKEVAGSRGRIGVFDVGYQLGPRLNAAGRLEDASEALQLLMTRDEGEAIEAAGRLDGRNRERQRIEKEITGQVISSIRERFDSENDFVLVEGQALWHIGVVGIVASRVVREFYRPSFVIGGGENGDWKGSGRSIEGFDLGLALRECDDLLVKHGGHAMAAGLTIKPENVSAFRTRLNEIARRVLTPEMLQPSLRLDAAVPLTEVSLETLEELGRLQPIGQGNPAVQLMSRNLRFHSPPRPLGREEKHLKMRVTDGNVDHEAVWWNGNGLEIPGSPFDLAYVPEINEYNGRRSVQLRVLDWQPSDRTNPH